LSGKLRFALAVAIAFCIGPAGRAYAQITLGRSDDGSLEFFTSGRLGGFVEVIKGDSLPQAYGPDPNNPGQVIRVHPVGSDNGITYPGDPAVQPDGSILPGPLLASRVRSGFLPNILGFGVHYRLSDRTTLTGYASIWATAETDSERTFFYNYPDEREGYVRADGRFGSLLVGRSLSLFSRGSTEIDFLYGHGFGVGSPAGFETHGPSGGHIGYGVIASVFAAGVVYATPSLAGIQLTAGYYDPATFVGLYWVRTKLGRPEAELTYDLPPVSQFLRLHLFVDGTFQKLYASDGPRSANVYGIAAGGRVEVGRFHLGAAGFYGPGLGVNYALNGSDAVVDQYHTQQLRKFDGLYVQGQVVLRQFDFNAGWGITRVHELAADIDPMYYDPNTGQPAASILKSRMGISGAIVYHMSPRLHFDIDYFRADIRWWLGEQQVVHTFNAGTTLTW
jgi:hypothetical protein